MVLRYTGILWLLCLAGCSDPTAILVHIDGAGADPVMLVPDHVNRLVISVTANGKRIMIIVDGFQGVFREASGGLVTEFTDGQISEVTIRLKWLEGECEDDDGDGYGDGRGCLGGDCDEFNPAVNDGAMERCNGLDDDCDGAKDEDFDLDNNIENCGSCGHVCNFANGSGECQDGYCVLSGCMGGYYDANQIPDDGCECSRTVPPDEVCDGLDNDCNGTVDDGLSGCAAGVCTPDKWCWENPLPQGNSLQAVWGSAENDVWAVGAQGVILHWNGSEWGSVDSATIQQLNGLWGSSAGEVWAVGNQGTILSYNGSAWSKMTNVTFFDLLDVWGSGEDDVWAVGDPGIPQGVVHYTSGSWGRESFPGTDMLQGVWGSAVNDVWAVGAWGKIFRYTGSSWQEHASGMGANDDLFGVWGSGAGDVWAVGTGITRFTGTTWQNQNVQTPTLHSVFGFGANDAWAVGDSGTIRRWQGTASVRLGSYTRRCLGGGAVGHHPAPGGRDLDHGFAGKHGGSERRLGSRRAERLGGRRVRHHLEERRRALARGIQRDHQPPQRGVGPLGLRHLGGGRGRHHPAPQRYRSVGQRGKLYLIGAFWSRRQRGKRRVGGGRRRRCRSLHRNRLVDRSQRRDQGSLRGMERGGQRNLGRRGRRHHHGLRRIVVFAGLGDDLRLALSQGSVGNRCVGGGQERSHPALQRI
jgi:hypothetical protein